MAQEDDLRALGKVMDFMRGISVIFLLVNCYWFCYEAFQQWHFTLGIINKILMNFQRNYGIVFIHPLDKTLLCGFPCLVLPWDKGRERGENHVEEDLGSAFLRLCLFLSQLVAVGIAHRKNWSGFALYLHALHWLYLSLNGWCMDEPTAEEQPDGRCIQHGE